MAPHAPAAPAAAPGVAAPLKVLHAAAEIFPLVKTGGLADVAAALPPALARAGADVRLVLPGLPAIADAMIEPRAICYLGAVFGAARVTVRFGRLPGLDVPAYVIDAPYLYRRGGGPYQDARGVAWPDNLQRFALLGWVAAHLAAGEVDPAWVPDVVHSHDWHAGLAPAYVAAHPPTEAASVHTIHNLAFQGLFPLLEQVAVGLPAAFMAHDGVEYHGQLSFMKAGLQFADRVTTVSPTYAREIATHEFGAGFDGVIRSRGGDVSGILNGVDGEVWDPATDAALAERYSAADLAGKARCKQALQAELGLTQEPDAPVFGLVSRLTHQKGIDLVAAALPVMLGGGAQLVVLGAGEPALEVALKGAEAAHPGRVVVRIGYDEALAHRIVAGADVILVPSRFEPCGLTQLYGLRYGTLPLVRRVGGLADTVVDSTLENLGDDHATGFVFDAFDAEPYVAAVRRACTLFTRRAEWERVQQRAMAQRFDWDVAAAEYQASAGDRSRGQRATVRTT